MTTAPIVMLGLDAADQGLVRAWIDAGHLPNLAELERRGLCGDLRSPADHYAGAVWPDFYTGSQVAVHGIYGNKLWRQEAMQIEVPTDAWLGLRPFYEAASDAGLKVCAVDVPMVLGRPRPLNGVNLCGWSTHDLIASGSEPLGLWADLAARHGAPRLGRERFGYQTAASLRALHAMMLDATAQAGDVALDLLGRQPVDLALIVFGATHRGGHYLYDTSQVDAATLSGADAALFETALLDIYRATDREVGRIVEALPQDATVIVFALHGMIANAGWSEFFGEMLASLEAHRGGRIPRQSLLYRLRRKLPFHLVRPILTRLPSTVSEALVRLWSRGMLDWKATTHFPMAMADAGYLRINLKGRERDGTVEPGEAYLAHCAHLEELIGSLVDADSGRPVAGAISRAWLDAQGAPARDVLPDLVVPWTELLSRDVGSVTSTLAPDWRFAVPRRLPSGRSGNHIGRAWMMAKGPRILPGALPQGHAIEDLAPTVMTLLGLEPEPHCTGRVIEELLS